MRPGFKLHWYCAGFSKKYPCFPLSIWLGDHVNGGLVELRLKPVYRRFFTYKYIYVHWHNARYNNGHAELSSLTRLLLVNISDYMASDCPIITRRVLWGLCEDCGWPINSMSINLVYYYLLGIQPCGTWPKTFCYTLWNCNSLTSKTGVLFDSRLELILLLFNFHHILFVFWVCNAIIKYYFKRSSTIMRDIYIFFRIYFSSCRIQ